MLIDLAPRMFVASPSLTRPRGASHRLLSEVLDLAGPETALVSHAERAWSSATFSGARHTIILKFAGAEAIECGEAFIAALPDHEFTVPGHLVADATIASVEQQYVPHPCLTVEAELLLLEDC